MKYIKLNKDGIDYIITFKGNLETNNVQYDLALSDNVPPEEEWIKDGDYIFPPDATEEQKAEIREITDRYKKEQAILDLLQKDKKIEALVKQANLSRMFLIALYEAQPQEVKDVMLANHGELLQELKTLNDEIENILYGRR